MVAKKPTNREYEVLVQEVLKHAAGPKVSFVECIHQVGVALNRMPLDEEENQVAELLYHPTTKMAAAILKGHNEFIAEGKLDAAKRRTIQRYFNKISVHLTKEMRKILK